MSISQQVHSDLVNENAALKARITELRALVQLFIDLNHGPKDERLAAFMHAASHANSVLSMDGDE